MELRYSSQARAERMVAVVRLVLAAFLVFYLQPFRTIDAFRTASLPLYLLYAVFTVIAIGVAWRGVPFREWTLASHVVDICFFGVMLFAGGRTVTPLFVGFLFPVISACLLFSWKQAILTGISMSAAFVAASSYELQRPQASNLLDTYITVGVSLLLLATLLIFIRSREEKLENEIASLSAWPIETSSEVPTRELLARAAAVLDVPRLIMTWEEPDEPWLHIAWRFGNDFQWIRESPAKYDPLVMDPLNGRSFIARPIASASSVIVRRDDAFEESRLEPLHSGFRRDFNIREVSALPLEGSTFSGYLFVLDRQNATPDDLVFGEVVARFVAGRLDHYYLLQRAQQLAIGEERIRLSRDLHDGVLQSLTGAALQLEAVRGMLIANPAEADHRLSAIQAVLATDQRELRSFIRQLRPTATPEADLRLSSRLASLSERMKAQWGIRVNLETSGMSQLVSQSLRHEIYSIVNEAVSNAAKHASASLVDVTVMTSADGVFIRVKDNGTGFAFRGRYTLQQLNETRRGPVTLKERVTSLGGDLCIESSDAGSLLEITIPLTWMGT